MAERELLPEPANGRLVLLTWDRDSGSGREVLVRDDNSAAPDDPHRWHVPNSDDAWLSWEGLHAEGDVEELVPRSEVDRLIAEARRDAGVLPLGIHLKEPGGWCRTHSIQHSETEWARIHDQLADEEVGSGG